mgnify:CR=1 FL=1
MLKYVACFQLGKKAKLLGRGKVLDLLVFSTVICGKTADRIAKEKNISNQDAMEFALDCIREGYKKFLEEN